MHILLYTQTHALFKKLRREINIANFHLYVNFVYLKLKQKSVYDFKNAHV